MQQTTVYTKITFKILFTKTINIIIIINIITILSGAYCSHLKGGQLAVYAFLCQKIF